MDKTSQPVQARRERMFVLLTLAAAGLCVLLAFWYAVPLRSEQPASLPDMTALGEYLRVDLNTADADALMALPGIGPQKAAAIVQDREENGPFSCVQDVIRVSGITQQIVDSWNGMAVVGA